MFGFFFNHLPTTINYFDRILWGKKRNLFCSMEWFLNGWVEGVVWVLKKERMRQGQEGEC